MNFIQCKAIVGMFSNYSEYWSRLKSILIGFSLNNHRSEVYSYSDHTRAKAISIFLFHANLATPKLDRVTVKAVLDGQFTWPNTSEVLPFKGDGLQLSVLEDLGLVAFYADWCTVHGSSTNPDDVDPSLIPLLQAIEHLKDISWGRNGYVRPHYECLATKLQAHWADHFGTTFVTELLPELIIDDDVLKLPPGNENFGSLVSTYLWQMLRETLEPGEAFKRWMLYSRVNCQWAFPVLFGDRDYEQKEEFNNELMSYVNQDSGLFVAAEVIKRQVLNKRNFSHIVSPALVKLKYTSDAEGNDCTVNQETFEQKNPTLDSLPAIYSMTGSDSSDSSDYLQFVRDWRDLGYWSEMDFFYAGLLNYSIEQSIRVESRLLASNGFAEKIIELAKSRPVLKHLVFNVFPGYKGVNYTLFLLSQPYTCDVALFYLVQNSFSSGCQDERMIMQSLDKGYQQLVCYEYLRAIETEPDSGDRFLKVLDFLGGRCNFNLRNFPKKIEYQFLLCFLENLSCQRVVQFGNSFSKWCIEIKLTHKYQRSQYHWYFIGFWLIERIEYFGVDPTGQLLFALRKGLLAYYKTEFEENLAGRQRSLEPNEFFSTLPWPKLVGNNGTPQLLEISNRCSDWLDKLKCSNENNFAVASVVRHYIQVLICVGQSKILRQDCNRIASRIIEIIRLLGFGPREEAAYLFDASFYQGEYDLWLLFCSYTNLLEKHLYDEFVDRCLPLIPLKQVFILIEHCTVIARTQDLKEIISARNSLESEDVGIVDIEQRRSQT